MSTLKRASALILYRLRPHLELFLVRRSEHLRAFPGQWTFPGGHLDAADQDAVSAAYTDLPLATERQTALRELFEETGYRAQQWAKAGVLHPVISYSTEFIEVWFAKDLSLGERKLDEGEFLEVFLQTPESLQQDCLNGKVTDAKTLTGMFWLQNVLQGNHALEWLRAP